jgi:hypothetical protein
MFKFSKSIKEAADNASSKLFYENLDTKYQSNIEMIFDNGQELEVENYYES